MPLNKPIAISLGFVSVYVVPANRGCVLVDTGVPKREAQILAGMAKYGLAPKDIQLILITHAHGDHIGSTHALAQRSGAPVMAHRLDAQALEKGIPLQPAGLTIPGKIVSPFLGQFRKSTSGFPHKPEIIIEDTLPLSEYGVRGKVIHTPGHTAGSLSMLLDSGEAVVGDLCAKTPYLPSSSYLPLFGDSRAEVFASWQRLLDAGVTTIYPGHGAPLSASQLREQLTRHHRGR
jgi:glyoxylase-like metal-dependent hydrolase (beta-lactamase superfamily II)